VADRHRIHFFRDQVLHVELAGGGVDDLRLALVAEPVAQLGKVRADDGKDVSIGGEEVFVRADLARRSLYSLTISSRSSAASWPSCIRTTASACCSVIW